MSRQLPRIAVATLALGVLAGCNLAPRYQRPAPMVAPNWPTGDAYLRQDEAELPRLSYTDLFRPASLQAVIAQALDRNQDLASAVANVAAARAQYRVIDADRLPAIGAIGAVEVGENRNESATTENYGVNIGLSAFEIDLFGRVRNLSRAALDQYLATAAGARAVRLSLIAETAQVWLTLAADRSLYASAVQTEAAALRSVELTKARLAAGISPRTDLRQAESVLAQAQVDKAELLTAIAQDRNALELLAGGPVADALLPSSLDGLDMAILAPPAGLDSGILLRRPDVVQAEYQLRAANARIGVARAAFFPRISLTAFAGMASTELGKLFDGGSFNWQVAPSAAVPLFAGGGNVANLGLAKAQLRVAQAEYQKAIQAAFRDVADGLAREGTIEQAVQAQARLLAAAQDNAMLAEARYRNGVEGYLALLIAQRTLYSAEQAMTRMQLARVVNRVSLFRALGTEPDEEISSRP